MPEPSFRFGGEDARFPGNQRRPSLGSAGIKDQSASGTQSVLRPGVLLTSVAMAPDATQLTLPAILTLLGVLLPGELGVGAAVWPAGLGLHPRRGGGGGVREAAGVGCGEE